MTLYWKYVCTCTCTCRIALIRTVHADPVQCWVEEKGCCSKGSSVSIENEVFFRVIVITVGNRVQFGNNCASNRWSNCMSGGECYFAYCKSKLHEKT